MTTEEVKKELKELSVFDFPDRGAVPDGYDMRATPEPTYRNMEVLIKKINEIIETVNKLK